MKLSNNVEIVYWNGDQLAEVPEFISKALNQYDFTTPGWLMRMNNRETKLGEIHIGTPTGVKIAKAGDYIIQHENGNLDVLTLACKVEPTKLSEGDILLTTLQEPLTDAKDEVLPTLIYRLEKFTKKMTTNTARTFLTRVTKLLYDECSRRNISTSIEQPTVSVTDLKIITQ